MPRLQPTVLPVRRIKPSLWRRRTRGRSRQRTRRSIACSGAISRNKKVTARELCERNCLPPPACRDARPQGLRRWYFDSCARTCRCLIQARCYNSFRITVFQKSREHRYPRNLDPIWPSIVHGGSFIAIPGANWCVNGRGAYGVHAYEVSTAQCAPRECARETEQFSQ